MEALAAAVEASGLATALRASRWTYPAVNTAHVLGLALLVGAVVPMDLRLMGLWRAETPVAAVLRLLRPLAAAGAALAVPTGLLLFTVLAKDYVVLRLFWLKLALVALGLLHALLWGGALAGASQSRQRMAGALSLVVWVTALVCGRMLAYL